MKKQLSIVAILCASLMGAQTVDKSDMDFAKDAADAGIMEVMLGELAVKKATSPDVKTLGQHMIDDHTKANKELMALAKKKGITLPSGLSKDAQKSYDDLKDKKTEDFDKAYSDMMVKDHKKVIDKFKHESEKGNDADLKAFASKTLPTLQHHLSMSEATCKKVDKK